MAVRIVRLGSSRQPEGRRSHRHGPPAATRGAQGEVRERELVRRLVPDARAQRRDDEARAGRRHPGQVVGLHKKYRAEMSAPAPAKLSTCSPRCRRPRTSLSAATARTRRAATARCCAAAPRSRGDNSLTRWAGTGGCGGWSSGGPCGADRASVRRQTTRRRRSPRGVTKWGPALPPTLARRSRLPVCATGTDGGLPAAAARRYSTLALKYSIVFVSPSRRSTFGSQPSSVRARVMSGRRTFGSSTGQRLVDDPALRAGHLDDRLGDLLDGHLGAGCRC